MGRNRIKSDGLPYRLYQRCGSHVYSIGYKAPDGKWAFRLKCAVDDRVRVAECRREAIQRAAALHAGGSDAGPWTFAVLCDKWIEWQRGLPVNVKGKRAASTIAENIREIETLRKAFGPMRISDITGADGDDYLEACLHAVDEFGNPRPRPEKGNKEIALACTMFKLAIKKRQIAINPFSGLEKVGLAKAPQRYVTGAELALAVDVGRKMGGPYHVMSLALKTAYLCVRRSFEVRHLTRNMITDEGIHWTASKGRPGDRPRSVLIEWASESSELRATIEEVLRCRRNEGVGTFYVFGNMAGRPYTKGGWKANLVRLMKRCSEVAAERGIQFEPFSLQHCRPMGVSDVLDANGGDVKAVMNATLHTSEKMIHRHYDVRTTKRAKPVDAERNSKIGISKVKRG
jgi:integrase